MSKRILRPFRSVRSGRPRQVRRPPALALLLLAGGCGSFGAGFDPPVDVDEAASRYVQLALALGEHDPLFLDLVFPGAPDLERGTPLEAIPDEADRLRAAVRGLLGKAASGPGPAGGPAGPRLRSLERSLAALGARARSLLGAPGGGTTAAGELRTVFGLELAELPEEQAEAARAAVDRSLPGVGPLRVRVRRHYERGATPPDRLPAELRRALFRCRNLVGPFPEPGAAFPSVARLEPVFLSPAEALALPTGPSPFHRYLGGGRGELLLPRGMSLRAPEVLRLACHEGAPGHHLQAAVAEAGFRETGWPERALVPLYGPRTAVFEGLAAVLETLPGDEPPADAALRELAPVALSTLAAFLDGRLSRVEAVRVLDFEALVPDPHPLLDHAIRFGSYALARPEADPAFHEALKTALAPVLDPGQGSEDRLARLVHLIREATSPAELKRIASGESSE